MFDISFPELLLILLVALLVIGPERLPRVARTLGLWVGRARSIFNSVRSDIEREVRVDELRKAEREFRKDVDLGLDKDVLDEKGDSARRPRRSGGARKSGGKGAGSRRAGSGESIAGGGMDDASPGSGDADSGATTEDPARGDDGKS